MANERLIDANELDEKLEILKVRFKAQGRDSVADDYNFVQTVLSTAPTVDAVPVVHGRWEPHPNENGFDRCSVCRDCVIYADWADGTKWGYCPNCGAKMDGGVR